MSQQGQFDGGLDSYVRRERETCKLENPRKRVRMKNCSLNTLHQKTYVTYFLVEVTLYLLSVARLVIVTYYISPSVLRLYL